MSSVSALGLPSRIRLASLALMKRNSSLNLGRICFAFSSVLVGIGMPLALQAQVNDAKVARDASGIYTGGVSGGRYYVVYDDPLRLSHGGEVPAINGRARVPLKDGKMSSSMSDADLPGNESAAVKGAEKSSNVTRGGKRIVGKAGGSMTFDDGPNKGPWLGSTLSATFSKKGSRWNSEATGTPAAQRNKSDPLLPPDHTKTVSGGMAKGRG